MNPYESTTLRTRATVPSERPMWSYRRSAGQGMLATIALPIIYVLLSVIYRMTTMANPLLELRLGLIQLLLVVVIFGTVGALMGLMTSFMGRIFLPVDPNVRSDETLP